jgi:hypothetical protein
MDELTLLRATRSEIPEPSLDDLEAGLARLEQRMSRRRPSARRRLVPVAAVAAAAAVAVIVGQSTVAVQSASAVSVLRAAATNTIRTADPTIGPGQFLEVKTLGHTTVVSGDDRWMRPMTQEVFIPQNASAEWILVSTEGKPDWFANPESRVAALDSWAAKDPSSLTTELRAKDGAFFGSPWQQFDVATLPRDPQALLDWFERYNNGGGASRDEENWENMVQLLRSGIPADLRAALYQALALIPGVTVGDRAATLDGRTGIAIGRTETLRGDRQEIIVDPDTGQLIGYRDVVTLPVFGYPVGDVISSTSVTTTVVDSAP